MKRAALIAILLAASLLPSTPADAHEVYWRTNIIVSQPNAGETFVGGTLVSKKAPCKANRSIRVFRNGVLYGSTTTAGEFWKVTNLLVAPHQAGDKIFAKVFRKRVRNNAFHQHTCNRRTSLTVTV